MKADRARRRKARTARKTRRRKARIARQIRQRKVNNRSRLHRTAIRRKWGHGGRPGEAVFVESDAVIPEYFAQAKVERKRPGEKPGYVV